jgi:hypothetical protein
MSVTVDSINYTLSGSNATITGTIAGAATTTTVTIPSTITYLGTTYNVTSIGDSAFFFYTNLASITIPDSVTTIGNGAFFYCSSLTSITIPNSVTSIGQEAFRQCFSLASITIPSSVLTINNSAFRQCSSLANIVVDSENTSYSSLNNVLFNKAQTTLILYAIGLSSTSYTIPNSVTSIDAGAFQGCNLTSITIPNGLLTIGGSAFYGCSLTSIFIPSSVTTIGDSYTFFGCPLTSILVDSANTSYSSLNNVLFNKAQTILIQYPTRLSSTAYTVPNTVQTISPIAFANSTLLESITIGSGVLTIHNEAFANCSKLATVTFNGNIPTIGTNNFTENTSDTAYYYPNVQNISRLSPTPAIFANVVVLRPTLLELKNQNALKSTYTTYGYQLQELVGSALHTLPELKQIGYVLGELKAHFTTETLITSWLFPGSELKQEGLIQSGITFFIIVIVFNGVFSVRRTYTSNNTNEEITQYNVFFNGQYLPTELSRKPM